MRKLMVLIVAVFALAAVVGGGVVLAGSGEKTVYTRGNETLKQNIGVSADLRFSPGPLTVKSGDTVTWINADKTGAPHTVTIAANSGELVTQFVDLFLGTCPACDAAIGAALGGHFGGGFPVFVLDGGAPGIDGTAGDSWLFFPGPGASAQITAPAGTTLLYFCAIHPWMMGSIEVN